MARIELKGTFISVGPIMKIGEKETPIQNFIFKEPGYTDQFGDKKSDDEIWKIQVMGESVTKHNLTPVLEGKKATLTVYINSRHIISKDPAKDDLYIINAGLSKYELYEKTA